MYRVNARRACFDLVVLAPAQDGLAQRIASMIAATVARYDVHTVVLDAVASPIDVLRERVRAAHALLVVVPSATDDATTAAIAIERAGGVPSPWAGKRASFVGISGWASAGAIAIADALEEVGAAVSADDPRAGNLSRRLDDEDAGELAGFLDGFLRRVLRPSSRPP
jgi:flavorubredoxin